MIYKIVKVGPVGGYIYAQTDPPHRPRHTLLHRVLMENKIGRDLTRYEVVHHIDGNKRNNDLSNLELMSLSDHTRMHQSGEGGSNAKLTAVQVLEISKKLQSGRTQRSLAREYGVCKSTIQHIKHGRRWKPVLMFS